MASTWSTGGLNLRLMTTGENDNTWGDQTNDNLKRLENKITGYAAVTLSGTTHTLTFTDNPTSYADEDGRNFVLNFGGSPGGTCTVTIPARETVYLVLNNTADSNTITLTTGSGTTFNVPAGKDAFVYSDGTNVYNAMADAIFTTITGDGSALTGVLHDVVDDTTPQLGGNLDLNSNNITGTGNINITGTATVSGDLTVDTNTLYVDSTNNRVGISTTSPSALLHIKQDAGTTPTLSTGTRFVVQRNTFGGDPNGMAIIAGNNTTDGAFIDFGISTDADIGKIKYDTQNNIFQFYANTIERFRIEPAEVVVNDPSNDVDFRVESNTNTHALFVDGGDSSVYIGKSDSSFGTAGVRLNVAGLNYNQFTRDGGSAVNINRLTSDGDLMAFYKDSTKVGSIGTYAGDIIIGTTDTGLRFDDGASAYIPWNTSTNSATNGTISLGATTVQYNNLYLSGTVTNDGSGGMSIDTSGNVTFNEGGIDADFRVETNTRTHMIFADGGTDRLSIWNNASRAEIAINSTNILIGGTGSVSDIFMHSGLGGGYTYAMTISPDFYGQTIFYEGIMSASADATTSSQNEWLRVKNLETIFNDNSLDKDFRVESNNNSTMLVVDGGSDVVLMAKGSVDNTTAGHLFNSDGFVSHVRSGNGVMRLNRLSNDGDILEIYKDGGTRGSIGSSASVTGTYIGDSTVALTFYNGANLILPSGGSSLNKDGAISLGNATNRFNNLHLAGSVYLGGTGSANALDDYEEGTFNPSLNFGGGTTGITYEQRFGNYTKIGRLVHYKMRIKLTSKGSSVGHAQITGFPFSPSDDFTVSFEKGGDIDVWSNMNTASNYRYTLSDTGNIALYKIDSNATSSFGDDAVNSDFTDTSDLRLTITFTES